MSLALDILDGYTRRWAELESAVHAHISEAEAAVVRWCWASGTPERQRHWRPRCHGDACSGRRWLSATSSPLGPLATVLRPLADRRDHRAEKNRISQGTTAVIAAWGPW